MDGAPLLAACAAFLDPLGSLMGLDGMILLAFLLGFPANEIVIPILLMGYLSTGALTDYAGLAELKGLLLLNGWTAETALCATIFMLFHFPCGTTTVTIYRETGSVKWTALAVLLPTPRRRRAVHGRPSGGRLVLLTRRVGRGAGRACRNSGASGSVHVSRANEE